MEYGCGNLVAPQLALLLGTVCIVIKYQSRITSLQFKPVNPRPICYPDIAFRGSMGIHPNRRAIAGYRIRINDRMTLNNLNMNGMLEYIFHQFTYGGY